MNGWEVEHVCCSTFKLVNRPELVIASEDADHVLVRCLGGGCEFFAWRAVGDGS